MRGRTDMDDDALDSLDRAWRGATEGIMRPLAIGDALHPVPAMSAWVRAGAHDPRCLWWVLARFGGTLAARLKPLGIRTAADLAAMDPAVARKAGT